MTSIYTKKQKKRTGILCQKQRSRENFKNPNFKFYLPNHGNIKRLRKATERANRYQVNTFGKVINSKESKEFKRKIKLKAHFALQENHDVTQLNYKKI